MMKFENFMRSKKGIVITFLLIFLIALFFRAWRLTERGEGMDEFHWIERGASFVRKLSDLNFHQATDNFERHPGIPAAFLMGTMINFFAAPAHYEIPNFVAPFKFSLKIMDPLTAARIPIVFLGALTSALLYFFASKIWNVKIGIIAGLLLALDPFHIALSQIAHQDVALTFFFMDSLFFYYLGETKQKTSYKIIAGIFFGLAFLTKIIALLIPIIIFIWKTIIYFNKKDKFKLPFDVLDALVILIGIVMFLIFYTEMWGDPVLRFIDHLKENFSAENAKDTHFFLGYTGSKTFLSFYLLTIPARLTLLSLIGLILSLFWGIKCFVKEKIITKRILLLIVSSLTIILIMSFFGKMKDRYILPSWPFLIIASSIGIIKIIEYFFRSNGTKVLIVAFLFVLLFSLPVTISFSPYYFLYYNSLAKFIVGGQNNIPKYLEVSWGEGFREAAIYLNEKNKEISAVSACQSCFKPYFKGRFVSWGGNSWFNKKVQGNDIDYAVISIRTVQRKSPNELYSLYVNKKPEKVFNINGMNVIWIYNLKK